MLTLPNMVNFSFGVVVPIPILPFWFIRRVSVPFVDIDILSSDGENIPVLLSVWNLSAGSVTDPLLIFILSR